MAETWDFQPDEPIEEALEWLTDILATRDGEQRLALRAAPRELLTMSHIMDQGQRAEALARLRAGYAGAWTVSLWPRIASDGSLPTRSGIVLRPPVIERARRRRSRMTVAFLLNPAADVAASPYPTYDGLDVVTDPTVSKSPAGEGLRQQLVYSDNETGPVILEPVENFVREQRSVSFVDRGFAARAARRLWLLSLHGRQKAFWLPSWGGELGLQGPVGAADTSLLVAPVGAPEDLEGRHLMVDVPGAPLFRAITGAVDDGGNHRLTVAPLGASVPQATLVHLLTKVRFAEDRITLRHFTTRTEMSAPVLEVPA